MAVKFRFHPKWTEIMPFVKSEKPVDVDQAVRLLDSRDKALEQFLSTLGDGTISTQFGQVVGVYQNTQYNLTPTTVTSNLDTAITIPSDTGYNYFVDSQIHTFCRNTLLASSDTMYLQGIQQYLEWLPGTFFEAYGYAQYWAEGDLNNNHFLSTPRGRRYEPVSVAPGATATHRHAISGNTTSYFDMISLTHITLYAQPI